MRLRSLFWPSGWWRKLLVWFAWLVALYALLGFVVLPALLPTQIVGALQTTLHRESSIEAVHLNPFLMSVQVDRFVLLDPDGDPLLEADELFVDLDVIHSAQRRAIVFDRVRLAGIRLHAETDADGTNNIVALVEAATASDEEPPAPEATEEPSALPPITVTQLELADVRADFHDRSAAEPFEFELGPLELTLENLSTRPDSQSPYTIAATAPTGEQLSWTGTLSISPLQSSGTIELDNLSLVRFWRYVRGNLPLDLSVADADIAASYEIAETADGIGVTIREGRVRVRDLGIAERGAEARLVELTGLDVDGVKVDVVRESVEVGRITLKGGEIDVALDPEGTLNFTRLAPASDDRAAAAEPQPDSGSGWKVGIEKLDLAEFGVDIVDNSVQPPVDLRLTSIALQVEDFATTGDSPFKVGGDLVIDDSGKLSFALETRLTPLSLDGSVDLSGLPLAAFESYVRKFVRLELPTGTATTAGTLTVEASEAGATAIRYLGSVSVEDLGLRIAGSEHDLLKWQKLSLSDFALDTAEQELTIGAIELSDPYAEIEIAEDGTLTVDSVRLAQAEAASDAAQTVAAEADGAGMRIRVDRVRLNGGTVQFIDRTANPDFRTSLDDVQLSLGGFALDNLSGVAIDLQAKVDDDAPLAIKGVLSEPGSETPADVKITLTGYDLTATSTYVGRYVGYEVDKGKLSLDLDYKLDRAKLSGRNDIVAQRFSLGRKVESAEATTLPVKMALAVLRDSKGRIALDVPVSGNLNDPKFSLRNALAGTFSNILQRAVTSPFSILSSVVGIGADELSQIEFEAGRIELAEGEQKKLEGLADALRKRPGLQLEIRGAADTRADGPALARSELDQRLEAAWLDEQGLDAAALGNRHREIDTETRQRLLFELYASEFGREITEPAGETVEARADRAQAALLREIEVGQEQLVQLGKTRSRVIRDAIEALGVPRAQLFRVKAKVVDKGRVPVPVQLTLTTTG